MLIRLPRLLDSLTRSLTTVRENRRTRQSRQRRMEASASVATERLEARTLLTVTGSGTFVPPTGPDTFGPTHSFFIDTSSPSNGNVHSVAAGVSSATFTLTGRIVGPGNVPVSHTALAVSIDGVSGETSTFQSTSGAAASFTISNVGLGLGSNSFTYRVGRPGGATQCRSGNGNVAC